VREWPRMKPTGSPRLHAVLERWLEGRGFAPLHFLVELRRSSASMTVECCCYADLYEPGKDRDQVLAVCVLSPVPAATDGL